MQLLRRCCDSLRSYAKRYGNSHSATRCCISDTTMSHETQRMNPRVSGTAFTMSFVAIQQAH